MKKLISVFLALVIAFTYFAIDTSAAKYSVKVKQIYNNGYTYVTLTPSTGTVYYTTDGTKPDSSDKKYTKTLKITKPVTLRMTIYKNGKAVKSVSKKIAVRVKAPSVKVTKTDDNRYTFKYSTVKGADVYYTVNGSTPSPSNGKRLDKHTKSVTVDPGVKVRAIAVKQGWKNSKVTAKTAPKKKTTGSATSSVTKNETSKSSKDDYVSQVIELINEERAKAGLSALTTTTALEKAADERAEELSEKFAHTRPDGSDCFSILDKYGIPQGWVGENIAAGQRTPEEVVAAWMSSEGHRENILNPNFKKVGVGYYKGGGYGHYWVQIFTS